MEASAPVGKPARGAVIYIVDDDPAVRDGFDRLLRSVGMDPRPYGSAETFLAEVVDIHGACILLDVTMPRLTGPEVLACLRDRRIGVPVISISARDDEQVRALARDLGACMFLHKPVDGEVLLDAIAWATGGTAGPAPP